MNGQPGHEQQPASEQIGEPSTEQESLQWVITAYAIFFGGVLLLGGRLADLLGRRRLFVAGLALFTVMSLLDGLAWSEGSLIAFRALQGLGARCSRPRRCRS